MAKPPPARFADAPILSARARAGVRIATVAVYGALVIGLIRGWQSIAPYPATTNARASITAVALHKPPDRSPPTAHRRAEGARGAAARRALADQIVAHAARYPLPAPTAAAAAGTGSDLRSGAEAGGDGTGGAAQGAGAGAGGAGEGSGGRYAVTKPVKIAGDLAESDYPRASRAKRLGGAVIVVLTVGSDGRVAACRVHQPSGDPDADAITCRLAIARFRFRPALDQHGDPIAAAFGWQQRFFAPGT